MGKQKDCSHLCNCPNTWNSTINNLYSLPSEKIRMSRQIQFYNLLWQILAERAMINLVQEGLQQRQFGRSFSQGRAAKTEKQNLCRNETRHQIRKLRIGSTKKDKVRMEGWENTVRARGWEEAGIVWIKGEFKFKVMDSSSPLWNRCGSRRDRFYREGRGHLGLLRKMGAFSFQF